jgi:hypothetical protein
MSQGVVNPFYYVDGATINQWDNSNPVSTIQIKRPYTMLQNATEWDLSILRATYPMNGIPLGICPMATGINVNTTPFTVSITRNGTTTTTSVVWTPEFKDAPVPTATTVQDTSSKYYWYTSVASLLVCFNAALATTATNAGSTNAPMLTFDPFTSLFTLFFPQSDYGSSITNAYASTLSWNAQTAQLFPNFASTSTGSQTTLRVPSSASSSTIASIAYSALLQEAPNITAWDSLSTLNMTTDLGIVPEDIAVSYTAVVGSSSQQDSQLTDIVVDSGTGQLTGGSRSGVLVYLPSSQPRWINLRTTTFNSFSIFLNWTSKMGATYPVVLPAGTQATMKMMFRHRSSRKGDEY